MESSNKFFLKSINSFKSGKFYQGVREFNSGLLREIENSTYSSIEPNLNAIIPFLESNSLSHESEQIIQFYLTHLKKHKDLKKGLEPLINFLKSHLSDNNYSNSILGFFNGFAEFSSNNPDEEIITALKLSYQDFIRFKNFSHHDEILKIIFELLIKLSMFPEVETISKPLFIEIKIDEEKFEYSLYTILVIAINGKMKEAVELLQQIRKQIPSTIQKESKVFQCCSEFLMASSSKDFNWVKELQEYFSDILKEKLLKILILNLIKKSFPEETKISIFDILK